MMLKKNPIKEIKQVVAEKILPLEVEKKSIEVENISNNYYYIQMAAWFEDEYSKLINILEKKDYSFEVKDAYRLGRDVQLVLVGPFDSSYEAKSKLRELQKIKKDAFITKI